MENGRRVRYYQQWEGLEEMEKNECKDVGGS